MDFRHPSKANIDAFGEMLLSNVKLIENLKGTEASRTKKLHKYVILTRSGVQEYTYK